MPVTSAMAYQAITRLRPTSVPQAGGGTRGLLSIPIAPVFDLRCVRQGRAYGVTS